MLLKFKGDDYGQYAFSGPIAFMEARLTLNGTEYCGRFESPPSDVKKNEAEKIIFKGPSLACQEPPTPTATPTATATATDTPTATETATATRDRHRQQHAHRDLDARRADRYADRDPNHHRHSDAD